jgi:AAA+ superfamily predicted ATPase
LKRERGDKFGERDMIFLAKAVQKKQRQKMSKVSVVADITVPRYTAGKTSGKKLMDRIVGLEAVKETLEMEINRQAYRNRLVEELSRRGEATDDYVPCRNMAFCGNPGTCKTTMARAMAVRMGEMGITNGIFLEVSREQLVGRYMGETSLKVAKVFERPKAVSCLSTKPVPWPQMVGITMQKKRYLPSSVTWKTIVIRW